jgi:hypothetical protein
MSPRGPLGLFCTLLMLAVYEPASAEGRKGTRIYTPDESGDYDALVEGQEKAIAAPETTSKEKLDQCMASWDIKTHITKANWRTICQRELSDGSL